MSNEKFWSLYDSGNIQVKCFHGVNGEDTKTVEAFEYDGMFYLRLHVYHPYKGHRWAAEGSWIKGFKTREHANNYFKKFAKGYSLKREF